MPADEHDRVDTFRRVARRFGDPPMLLRLALAGGLNGQPEAARQTLRRLCAMHAKAFCEEGRQAWQQAQMRRPALGAVAFP